MLGLPWWLSGKVPTCQCRRSGFDSWVRKILWRRKWQPTSVFLLGESQEQKSLTGYIVHGVSRVEHDLSTKPPPPGATELETSQLCGH